MENRYTEVLSPAIEHLIALRKAHELDQVEVAVEIGVDRSTYTHIESGYRRIRVEQLIILAEFYGVPLDLLVKRSDCYIDCGSVRLNERSALSYRTLKTL